MLCARCMTRPCKCPTHMPLDYGYGFMWGLQDYIYNTVEGAELAAMMAQGFGSGVFDIFIYPYFDGIRGRLARCVVTAGGSVQGYY